MSQYLPFDVEKQSRVSYHLRKSQRTGASKLRPGTDMVLSFITLDQRRRPEESFLAEVRLMDVMNINASIGLRALVAFALTDDNVPVTDVIVGSVDERDMWVPDLDRPNILREYGFNINEGYFLRDRPQSTRNLMAAIALRSFDTSAFKGSTAFA